MGGSRYVKGSRTPPQLTDIFLNVTQTLSFGVSHMVCVLFVTLLWAYTTEPSNFQVPPLRSMRTMRKICRKRMLRKADVAKMFPCVPAAITAIDATKTMKSKYRQKERNDDKDWFFKNAFLLVCEVKVRLQHHLWRRRASLRSVIDPAILCTCSSIRQPRPSRNTPDRTPRSSQTPAGQWHSHSVYHNCYRFDVICGNVFWKLEKRTPSNTLNYLNKL